MSIYGLVHQITSIYFLKTLGSVYCLKNIKSQNCFVDNFIIHEQEFCLFVFFLSFFFSMHYSLISSLLFLFNIYIKQIAVVYGFLRILFILALSVVQGGRGMEYFLPGHMQNRKLDDLFSLYQRMPIF